MQAERMLRTRRSASRRASSSIWRTSLRRLVARLRLDLAQQDLLGLRLRQAGDPLELAHVLVACASRSSLAQALGVALAVDAATARGGRCRRAWPRATPRAGGSAPPGARSPRAARAAPRSSCSRSRASSSLPSSPRELGAWGCGVCVAAPPLTRPSMYRSRARCCRRTESARVPPLPWCAAPRRRRPTHARPKRRLRRCPPPRLR